jgi:acyl-CoA reductase-like NAD-dependent aldehyde dehydrogenase
VGGQADFVINASQRDRVMSCIDRGKTDGAALAVGGGTLDGPGYFVEPTVFFDVNPQSMMAREEIFGPVAAVMPFDTIDQDIRLANDTRYGLAAAIWTQDLKAAHTVASKVRAGAVWVNGWAAIDPALPWGGMKTSGIGRELGLRREPWHQSPRSFTSRFPPTT